MDKSSAYGAKGPGFNSRWRQEFIIIKLYCMFCSFEKIKLQLGPTNKKKKKKKKMDRQQKDKLPDTKTLRYFDAI